MVVNAKRIKNFISYRLSKLATLHLIDDVRLERELVARELQCEYPRCEGPAIAMSKSGIPWLMCRVHKEQYDLSPRSGIALDSVVRNHAQWIQLQIMHLAYADSDDTVIVQFDENQHFLDQARTLTAAADRIILEAKRQHMATLRAIQAVNKAARTEEIVQKFRPNMATLPDFLNEESEDIFDV